MKTILISLILGVVAVHSSFGQTLKNLTYNASNGEVIANTGSNVLTFTNPLQFATNSRAITRTNLSLGATWLTNTNVTNFRSAIGLGATNTVAFDTIQIQSDIFTPALEAADGANYVILTAAEISFQGVSGPQTRTNLGLGASWLTNTNSTNFRTAIGLGSAATNDGSAFQPSSANLTNLASNNAINLTNFPTLLLRTNGSAAGLTNFPTLNQNTTGTASNVTGVVALANGGTGATNATNARTNLGLGTAATNASTDFQPSSVNLTNLASNNAINLTNFPALLLRTNGSAAGLISFPTLNQNTTGTASNVTGVVAITNGGMGTNTAGGARTNLELGITNTVTFSNITANGTLGVSNTAAFATNVSVAGNLTVKSLVTSDPVNIILDATQTSAATNGVLTLPDNANLIRLTNNNAISAVTNGRLGSFYYLVNQATNAVTLSNVGGITIDGATNLTLAPNESATLVALGPTNISVANRGGLETNNNVTFSNITASGTITATGTLTATGNVTMNGSGNLAPSQTANSASSLMTRDLVGQEFVTPRNRMQTTYWFGLEGLGGWQMVNSGSFAIANRTPRFGPSLAFYAVASKPATTASGVGVRLGSTSISGQGAWRPTDGGAFTARTHVVNYYGDNRAFGFSFAGGGNTNFWGAPDSFGLFWVQQPTNSWVASTAFALHERIAVSNIVWAVATAGTTDTNAPTWTDLIGSTVTNGTAVFRNIGPHTSNNWVLAKGHTNASQVVMTNTGKTNWVKTIGTTESLLTLRYGTNTAAPYTVYGSVADGTGQGSEVTLNLSTNTVFVSPQYWLRWDGTSTNVGSESGGIRYFSMDAETPPLN
jgi:hypothetical protein